MILVSSCSSFSLDETASSPSFPDHRRQHGCLLVSHSLLPMSFSKKRFDNIHSFFKVKKKAEEKEEVEVGAAVGESALEKKVLEKSCSLIRPSRSMSFLSIF